MSCLGYFRDDSDRELHVHEVDGSANPLLMLKIRGDEVDLTYSNVESLYNLLGSWLLDCLVTGRVRKP